MATNRRGGHRVQEVTTSGFGGTGAIQLNGTPSSPKGRRTFVSAIGDGNRTVYEIDDGDGNWERGIGTVSSGSPDTISRDAVISSSASDAKVNFSAGQKDVYIPFGVDDMPGVRAVSSDTTLTAADHNLLVTVDASGATRTITLPALADIGKGGLIGTKKTDSAGNNVTIDGDSSETIDGFTTFDLVAQYDVVWLEAGDSEWHVVAASLEPIYTKLTSGGTHNLTAGRRRAYVRAQGAGGGGGYADGSNADRSSGAGGGGGGGRAEGWLDIKGISSSTITIGSAGTGGDASTATAATDGGDAVWNDGTNTLTGGGGKKGTSISGSAGVGSATAGDGGNATGGDIQATGQPGGAGWALGDTAIAANNGLAVGGYGGSSLYGGGGTQRVVDGDGQALDGDAGAGSGSGGSGAAVASGTNQKDGGGGSAAIMEVWEYY